MQPDWTDLDLAQGRGDMDGFRRSWFHLSNRAVECWLGRYRHSEESGVAFDVADRFNDCFEVASPHGAVVEVLGR